jgi:hypothetical protein
MYKDEVQICSEFKKELEDLILYNQVYHTASFMWYHIPNGQKAAGS